MKITNEYVDVPASDDGTVRTFVAAPAEAGKYPGVLFYSDIFQLTGPMLRFCARLAGYGFVVAAPEIYRRIEPPGLVIPFDDAGRTRGLEDAAQTSVEHFDADCRILLSYLTAHPAVAPGQLAAGGFCLGGHLAFRAALQPDVGATVCFYGTGIHNGKLGKETDAGSLGRASEIRGELLLVWGALDPHIPEDGRRKVEEELQKSGARFSQRSYPAEHAFMRDEGARYDSEATDAAFGEMISLYRRTYLS
ncbi:MAG: carboxymethylenebutenolidase [Acidobacteriota bacterium]|jgi:carboxymethylenebutenolidase|nr:carboxymethylenebutenolidase [Acidobacteriota bacterium]MDT7779457.1 carboxymethylenebutenolidase [Acidobacteriota bacterium]